MTFNLAYSFFLGYTSKTCTGFFRKLTLRKKSPYSELFSSAFSRIWARDMEYLSVFSPNAGKSGPEKLPTLTLSRSIRRLFLSKI